MTTPDPALVQAAQEWLEKDCPHSTKDAVLTPGTCADCIAAFGAEQRAEERAENIKTAGIFAGCGDHVYPREGCPHCANNSAVVDKIVAALRAARPEGT